MISLTTIYSMNWSQGDTPLLVNAVEDTALFVVKMDGGYNCMHAVQYAAKSAKSILGISGKSIAKCTAL